MANESQRATGSRFLGRVKTIMPPMKHGWCGRGENANSDFPPTPSNVSQYSVPDDPETVLCSIRCQLDSRRQLYATRLEASSTQADYAKSLAVWQAATATAEIEPRGTEKMTQ